jgi:hypothetical protein
MVQVGDGVTVNTRTGGNVMRTFKRLGILAVAVLALGVVGVASASAAGGLPASFSESSYGEASGKALEPQVFKFNGGSLTCSAAATDAPLVYDDINTRLRVRVYYSGCKAFSIVNVEVSPVSYIYNVDGQLEIAQPFTVKVLGGILGTCTVTVPGSQTLGTLSFATVNTNNLKVAPNISGIDYTTSGGLCGSSGSNGAYTGASELSMRGTGFIRYYPAT